MLIKVIQILTTKKSFSFVYSILIIEEGYWKIGCIEAFLELELMT